jgi:hypothetical protein
MLGRYTTGLRRCSALWSFKDWFFPNKYSCMREMRWAEFSGCRVESGGFGVGDRNIRGFEDVLL